MVGFLLIAAAAGTAFLVAAAARLPLVSTLLVAYVAFVANLGLTTLALSPFHAVTRTGLGLGEIVLLAGAFALWWKRGRPRPHVAVPSLDAVTWAFVACTAAFLAYELFLALSMPPNNMDALTYHMPRAAAWAQHHGVEWIANGTVRMNEFQPLAEQQLLFLFVATGSGLLYALPQYLAQLAILAAIYGAARRLGFDARRATCAACLTATFSIFVLESTTAQNDLVAASFAAVAACLLLSGGLLEAAIAGAALGMGLGVKLTVGFAVPALAWLAIVRGRRTVAAALAGGVAGFVLLGLWGFVLNHQHTGSFLGDADAKGLEDRGSPAYPQSVATFLNLLYGTMDLSVLSNRLIHVLAIAGVAAAAVVFARRRAASQAGGVALPLLAPLLVVFGAWAVAKVAGWWGLPIRGPNGMATILSADLSRAYGHLAKEDWSAFGPIGIVSLIAAIVLAVRHRADRRQLALASALPVAFVLLALFAAWVPFLTRFVVVPAVVSAPLLARLFAGPVVTASYLVAAVLVGALTITNAESKPLGGRGGFGRPWQLTQSQALYVNSRPEFAASYDAFRKLVPPHACVGAILAEGDPSYLFYGHGRRVFYLPHDRPLEQTVSHGLFYVVISNRTVTSARDDLPNAGWKLEPLGPQWVLAVAPRARANGC